MTAPKENPAALAGAHRVQVTELVSRNDAYDNNETVLRLQVRRILKRYAVSIPVAVVIAELTFKSGGPS